MKDKSKTQNLCYERFFAEMQKTLFHVCTLVRRCWSIRFCKRWNTASLWVGIGAYFLLPFIVGVLIRIAVGNDGPDYRLFSCITMIWLCTNQTCCEITTERDILLQEKTRGVSIFSFLTSKIVFFFLLTLLQSLLIASPWFIWEFAYLSQTSDQILEGLLENIRGAEGVCRLGQAIILGGLWGTGLGLCISSAFSCRKNKKDSDVLLVSVLLTLPQILFSTKVTGSSATESSISITTWLCEEGSNFPPHPILTTLIFIISFLLCSYLLLTLYVKTAKSG